MNNKTMRDIILVGIGAYVGWYLAMNEASAVRKGLNQAEIKAARLKDEAIALKEEMAQKIKENDDLQNLLDEYVYVKEDPSKRNRMIKEG